MQTTERDRVHLIEMMISIEHGEGAPAQVGFSSFLMRETNDGWRVLPDAMADAGSDGTGR